MDIGQTRMALLRDKRQFPLNGHGEQRSGKELMIHLVKIQNFPLGENLSNSLNLHVQVGLYIQTTKGPAPFGPDQTSYS